MVQYPFSPMVARMLAATLATALFACGNASPTASSDAPVDAGADAEVSSQPCRAGGVRGTPLGAPLDRPGTLVGASHGRVYWTDSQSDLWSMAQDGSDRRIIHKLERGSTLRFGDDAIYATAYLEGRLPIVRIPFEGGPGEAAPFSGAFLIGVDADSFYVSTSTSVGRVSKVGGAMVTLATTRDPTSARLAGATLWLGGVDELSWVDARGDGSQPLNGLGVHCRYRAVSEARVACEQDGILSLISRERSVQTLVTRPLAVTADTPAPQPLMFVRRAGTDGVLFTAPTRDRPFSLAFVALAGGASSELTCVDSDPQLALDGDQLFILDVAVEDPYFGRSRISRVDLR